MVGCLVVFIFWGGLFPNTFLKPMEATLGATRLMAINKAASRPSWADASQDIDKDMNLVANGQVISPAKLYFDLEGQVAMTGAERERRIAELTKRISAEFNEDPSMDTGLGLAPGSGRILKIVQSGGGR
jgi:hypothetical protein